MIEQRPVDVGDTIANRYRILRILGSGGMAVVYEAEHQLTGRRCALKMIHAHLAQRPEWTSLFLKEAKVGSTIGQNPHIVEVLDADFDAVRGVPFLAMELLNGETVEQRLSEQGPFEHAQAARLFRQLGDAFTQAHAQGVIHRDLKAANLFLVSDRNAQPMLKVMDFGIAKVLGEEAQRTATQMGTPVCLAPEQMGAGLRQLAEKEGIQIATGVSVGTDIWGLGLLAYEMLTGLDAAQYWNAEVSPDLFLRVALSPLERPSIRAGDRARLLPEGFDAWFARTMQKNAAARWASFAEAVTELTQGLEPVKVEPAAPEKTVMQTVLAQGPIAIKPGAQVTEKTTQPFDQGAATTAAVTKVPPVSLPRAGKTKLVLGIGAIVLLLLAAYWPAKGYLAERAEQACESLPPGEEKVNACQKACEAGRSLGCNDLGNIYEQGQGIEKKDEARAANSYEKACNGGNLSGCKNLESMYLAGKWRAQDETLAASLHQKACDSGEMRGCSNLGAIYERGIGIDKKYAKPAADLYQKACDGGELNACSKLSRLVTSGNGPDQVDSKRVTELFQKACDGGDMALCRDLGLRFETGTGGEAKDAKRAADLYQKACNGGEMSSCTHLAGMYKLGAGVGEKNEVRAAELYRKACDGGAMVGCNNLADMYLNGHGVDVKDAKRAVELFQKACAGDEMTACTNLAGMYSSGTGVDKKDETRALELYKKACRLGSKKACGEQQRLAN